VGVIFKNQFILTESGEKPQNHVSRCRKNISQNSELFIINTFRNLGKEKTCSIQIVYYLLNFINEGLGVELSDKVLASHT
jgi:hypothetical protein